MNSLESKERLLTFINKQNFSSPDDPLKKQAEKCFLDLAGVICAGAKNHTAKTMAEYVKANYPQGEYTILATGGKTNFIGAALANGMAANAMDMDDGYSLLRGHPGAGFFGALLSAAQQTECTYGEFLNALIIGYETSIRQGYAIRNYYGWDHSSGSYAAFATVASVASLLKPDAATLENALSIADFIMPVNPAKRSCYYPSMNKDGIYWGQHAGAQAITMAKAGITGKNPVIFDEAYADYLETLGKTYYIFDLYFKFHSCCRWAHGPILAVKSIMEIEEIKPCDIAKVDIYSFGNAGTLYQQAPACEDEAQYNIVYPIAAQIVFGDCGPLESSTTKMLDGAIVEIMKKIEFHHEEEYDRSFPAKRYCRAEITLENGSKYISPVTEPFGESKDNVGIEIIRQKFIKINSLYVQPEQVREVADFIVQYPLEGKFREISKKIEVLAQENRHQEIKFI